GGDPGQVRAEIEEWEALAPLLHTLAARADYTQKRWMLRALGERAAVWRADYAPRYRIHFDFSGLATGIHPDTMHLDDHEIAALPLRVIQGAPPICKATHQ